MDELTVLPAAWSMLRMGRQQSLLCCFSWVEDVYPLQDPTRKGVKSTSTTGLCLHGKALQEDHADRQPSAGKQGPAGDGSARTAPRRRLN